ncbi:hypothetical protein [Faecalibacterium sp.]|jgi:hypothetical protein|uniref:hypothetical protein n=1 Tax=Faecalibacterium sp. TaxID=1971605 RepID=UPI002201CD67|nr:MAG: Dam-replacing family protein [Bacteriophage sp.]
MEQFTNTEEPLRRIRENVPEILGGESNPDMEDEVEQIMCVVENAPRVAPEGVRPVAHIAWRKRPKQFVVYDPVPTNECLYDGKPVYTQRVLKLEEYTVPFCSNCDHRLDDCAGSFCPVCGSIIEERRRT